MAIICRDSKLLFIMIPGTGCSSVGSILTKRFGGEFIPQTDIYKQDKKILDCKHNSIKELVEFNLIGRAELSLYLKFATVRNPFDSLATDYQRSITDKWIETSIYWQKQNLSSDANNEEKRYLQELEKQLMRKKERVKNMGFEAWLEHRLGLHKKKSSLVTKLRKCVKLFIDPYHMPRVYSPLLSGVDEVIRFEHLEEDFNNLLKKAGIIKRDEWIAIPNVNPTPEKRHYKEYYTEKARKLVENNLTRELATFGYRFE
jgi:Sulfotransferase family